MRRGIKWRPPPEIGMDRPATFDFHGVPVVFDAEQNEPSTARGFWPVKRIVVGPTWLTLPRPEQQALLWHELGHIRGLHMELRVLLLLFAWTKMVLRICHAQEFAADRYAAANGYGLAMMRFIGRAKTPPTRYYPHPLARAMALRLIIEGDTHGVSAPT